MTIDQLKKSITDAVSLKWKSIAMDRAHWIMTMFVCFFFFFVLFCFLQILFSFIKYRHECCKRHSHTVKSERDFEAIRFTCMAMSNKISNISKEDLSHYANPKKFRKPWLVLLTLLTFNCVPGWHEHNKNLKTVIKVETYTDDFIFSVIKSTLAAAIFNAVFMGSNILFRSSALTKTHSTGGVEEKNDTESSSTMMYLNTFMEQINATSNAPIHFNSDIIYLPSIQGK